MHEMSIAMSVIDAVTEKARQEGCSKVTGIELVVGHLSGVEVESLKFCFSAACRDTPADGAELVIEECEAVGRCEACGETFPITSFYAKCPSCAQFRVQIESGQELSVRSITIE
ncbi:hydrogenase nickel insertion protein HypA [Chlorobaculum parvum NCIB 8327]|uniref:Hydrogenase maturation factor HypA n=1 Tax=Chlorobaculum parvum (strain DSM 263 / NCIMB 8327) TaxID=517417 RepID=HYPA_CHLP8|nr:hydrogenase maturation nickel metallochaperone HypA [Chlorobaculum parvum]B3QQ33.1 RecName: Full=Hydrogenase maturation factor HypA [Chlorobaculum parvum NCIB 8327]ACF12036.1 hydrogenase nickel insertion protein HypA [Chlorobaculum parvum NCIB 8327]